MSSLIFLIILITIFKKICLSEISSTLLLVFATVELLSLGGVVLSSFSYLLCFYIEICVFLPK
jgi:hypothetical protein